MQNQPDVRRAYTDCRFGQMHYRVAGLASDKPSLILLHQNPSSSLEYENFMRELARDRQVFAFDTPGNGMSDRPPGPQSAAGYAAAFADALDALELGRDRPLDVFGYHTGTYLSTELAIVRPDRIGRIVLSGIPMRSAEECAAALAAARAVGLPRPDGEDIFEWLRFLWTYIVVDRLPGVSMEIAVRTFADKLQPMHRRAWPYHAVWSYDARRRLPLVCQPVLILQPHEPLLEASRAAAELFPDARFVEMPQLSRDIFEVGIPDLVVAMKEFLS